MSQQAQHECKLPEQPERPGAKFTCPECGAEYEYISDCVYGFPCVENPHDFSPDGESCTPEEIAFWEDAKKRWDAGERDVRGARCETLTNEQGEYRGHITRTTWGIGVNSIECWENIVDVEEEAGL
jgi:hypothetical protein